MSVLLSGIMISLVCVLVGIYFLINRYSAGKIQIEFGRFGKINTTQTGLALIFLSLFLFVLSQHSYIQMRRIEDLRTTLDKVIITTARNLRQEFHAIVDIQRPPVVSSAFSRVNLFIGVLQQIDPMNGHALYYAGEVKRAEGMKKEAQQDFYRYIEAQDALPNSERSKDTGAEICYATPKGFCRQRSGWIHHLLANDFYSDALSEKNPATQEFLFERALTLANASLLDFPGGFGGPGQLIPTKVLVEGVKIEIERLKKK